MIIDGVRYENISCPRCRFRHPELMSCAEAAAYASEQREKFPPAKVDLIPWKANTMHLKVDKCQTIEQLRAVVHELVDEVFKDTSK